MKTIQRRYNIKPLTFDYGCRLSLEDQLSAMARHAISSPILHIDQKIGYALLDLLQQPKTLKEIIIHFTNQFPYPIRISTLISQINYYIGIYQITQNKPLYHKTPFREWMELCQQRAISKRQTNHYLNKQELKRQFTK